MTMPHKRSYRHRKNYSKGDHEFPDRSHTAKCDTGIDLRVYIEHKNQVEESHNKRRNAKFHGANIGGCTMGASKKF